METIIFTSQAHVCPLAPTPTPGLQRPREDAGEEQDGGSGPL